MSTTGIIVTVVVVIAIALIVAATWGWGSCDAVDCDTGSARSTTERLSSPIDPRPSTRCAPASNGTTSSTSHRSARRISARYSQEWTRLQAAFVEAPSGCDQRRRCTA